MALGVTHNSSAAWAKPPRRAAASNAARACMGGMRRTGGRVMGRLHHRGRRAASGTDRTNPRGVDPAGYGAGPIPDLFQPGPKRNRGHGAAPGSTPTIRKIAPAPPLRIAKAARLPEQPEASAPGRLPGTDRRPGAGPDGLAQALLLGHDLVGVGLGRIIRTAVVALQPAHHGARAADGLLEDQGPHPDVGFRIEEGAAVLALLELVLVHRGHHLHQALG